MTTLGLAGLNAPKADIDMGFRTGWLKHVALVMGGAGGVAIVLGVFKLLDTQPDKSFALLQSWGPNTLLCLVGILAIGKLFEGLNTTVRESFTIVASGVKSAAESQGRTADALTRLADQGSRQAEQVERLAIYAAQEFPGLYERLDKQDDALRELASGVKGLHKLLSNEKAALEKKQGENDGSGGA